MFLVVLLPPTIDLWKSMKLLAGTHVSKAQDADPLIKALLCSTTSGQKLPRVSLNKNVNNN